MTHTLSHMMGRNGKWLSPRLSFTESSPCEVVTGAGIN